MKINLDESNKEVKIEIISLIDVSFCILIFLILATLQLTRQQAINVDLPKSHTGKPEMEDMLIVRLNEFNQVYMGKEQQLIASKEQFQQYLTNYHQKNPKGAMMLYASKEVKYNDVVQVLDLLREVGGNRVGLATLPDSVLPSFEPNQPVIPPAYNIPGLPLPSGKDPLTPYNTYPNSIPDPIPSYQPIPSQSPLNPSQKLPKR